MSRFLEALQLAFHILLLHEKVFLTHQFAVQLPNLRPRCKKRIPGFIQISLKLRYSRRFVDHLQQRLLILSRQFGNLSLAENTHRKAIRCDGLNG